MDTGNDTSKTKRKSASEPKKLANTSFGSIRLNRRSGDFLLTTQVDEQSIIDAAKLAIGRHFKRHSFILNDFDRIKDFLILNMAMFEREVFACLFLDNKHRLICFEPIFYGTVNHAQTDAREIIKQALACNATALIAVHNHPSGNPKPSQQDVLMTQALSVALDFSGIKLLDHFVVGSNKIISMQEKGLFDPD